VPAPAASAASVKTEEDAPAPASSPRVAAPVRSGAAVARSAGDDVLFVADEDHGVVRKLPLPLREDAHNEEVTLPGPPAQVLALADKVLVTIRDPGLLLVLAPDPAGTWIEQGRIEVAPDAWGLAVTKDEELALVTSAWTHRVTAVDLPNLSVRYSLDVAREPRGIVISDDGSTAYVSHLVGSDVTRIAGIRGRPTARAVALPPSPLRAPPGVTLGASLGYATVLSPDGSRLFVARHALGAQGAGAWFGAGTVDVLLTAKGTPLAPAVTGNEPETHAASEEGTVLAAFPLRPVSELVQPRAMVYRSSKKTLIVASEGNDTLVELDATAVDPSIAVVQTFQIGIGYDEVNVASSGGAPSGIALSSDENVAYVLCRSTNDVVAVHLDRGNAIAPSDWFEMATDALPTRAALGRKLFYNATDALTSGGLACAGCHPEGRDDGFVWSELEGPDARHPIFVGGSHLVGRGMPRQTPMLAARVAANGPYGWHAQSETLADRAIEGFHLHRWADTVMPHSGGWGESEETPVTLREKEILRAEALADFLRTGLVAPPRPKRALTTQEARGKALFFDGDVGCSNCHQDADYTDRTPHALKPLPPLLGFDDDREPAFKTPSLLGVGGTPPYYHDGREASLEDLLLHNDDRMGKTRQLSDEDRAALAAFLRTL
jgi:cytochrome c peroxidase